MPCKGVFGEYDLTHEVHDRISRELAVRIAAELPGHPEWIEAAKANLRRWSWRNRGAPGLLRCYAEWEAILEKPVADICTILTGETDEHDRLRHNSPFVGILSPKEVWAIKQLHFAVASMPRPSTTQCETFAPRG